MHFAEGQPAVLRRLATLLRELAWRAPSGALDRELAALLDRVVAVAEESTALDGADTTRWRRQFTDALAGRWSPGS